MKWTPDKDKELLELKEQKFSNEDVAEKLNVSIWSVVKRYQRIKPKKPIAERVKGAEELKYKSSYEKLPDGSHKSDKLLVMDDNQEKDINFVMAAHGFSTDEFELVSLKNNFWNVYSKEDKVQTLYSSKITVKPKIKTFRIEDLLETIKEIPSITYKVEKVSLEDKRLLEIPIYDPHFGISTLDDYKQTQHDIHKLITSKRWEEVLFIIGQDLLHNDNFKGTTANNTPIERVDMKQAWIEAYKFYVPLIEGAIESSNSVKIIFSKGNHDESKSWCFVQVLAERFPQVFVDDEIEERKAHTFENIFIGITHGDKARKKLHNLFPVEFPEQWAKAKTREVHMGHLHTEDASDVFGMMIRTLSTRNKTDQWHKDFGFVGNHKRFMLFEYNENELRHVHYV